MKCLEHIPPNKTQGSLQKRWGRTVVKDRIWRELNQTLFSTHGITINSQLSAENLNKVKAVEAQYIRTVFSLHH